MQNVSVLTIRAAGIHMCQNGMETTYISVPGMSVEESQEPTACRLQDKTDMQLLSDAFEVILKKMTLQSFLYNIG